MAVRRATPDDIDDCVRILWAGVAPECRGRGFGSRLLAETLGWRPGNPAAVYVRALH